MIITIELDTEAAVAEVRCGDDEIAEIIDAEDLYSLVVHAIPRKVAEIYKEGKNGKDA